MQLKVHTIIFDLVGVVLYLSEWKMLRLFGIKNALIFFVIRRKNPVKEAFALLELMRQRMPGEYQQEISYRKRYLPLSICLWQRGIISAEECMRRIVNFIEYLDTQDYFRSVAEKKSMYWLLDVFFNPSFLIQALSVNTKVIQAICMGKDQNKKIFLLTNIDKETWADINVKFKDVIALFDGIVTSSETQLLKPDADIFYYLCKTFDIDPQAALFIDDQYENCSAAKKIGMKAVHYSSSVDLSSLVKNL